MKVSLQTPCCVPPYSKWAEWANQAHSELIFPRSVKFISSHNPTPCTCNARVQNEPHTCEAARTQAVIKPRNIFVMYDGLVAGIGKTQENFSPISTKWIFFRRKRVVFVWHLFSVAICDFWHLLNRGRLFYNPGIMLKMSKSINYWL